MRGSAYIQKSPIDLGGEELRYKLLVIWPEFNGINAVVALAV